MAESMTPAEKARITRRENAENRAKWRAEHDRQAAADKASLANLMRDIVADGNEDRKTRLFAAVVLNEITDRPYFSHSLEFVLRERPDIQKFRDALNIISGAK